MSLAFPWPWSFDYSPGAAYEIEPSGIYANTTLRFCKFINCYPASLWALKYSLIPSAGGLEGAIKFESVPLNGGSWHFIEVLPDVTKTWKPGLYAWQCFAENDADATQRYYVSAGSIMIDADFSTSGAVDTRGKWEKILDTIDQMILDTAGDVNWEVVNGGTGSISFKGWTKKELIEYRDYAAEQAGNEKRIRARKGGAPNPRFKYAVMGGGLSGGPVFAPIL